MEAKAPTTTRIKNHEMEKIEPHMKHPFSVGIEVQHHSMPEKVVFNSSLLSDWILTLFCLTPVLII